MKTNCRSYRYSDEVAAILAQQEGKSDNDKFEQLVLTCYYKLPELQKREADLRKSIAEKLDKLRVLDTLCWSLSQCKANIDKLKSQVDSL